MKRFASLLLALALVTVTAPSASAQDEAPGLVEVTTLSVSPAHQTRTEAAIAKVVQAATMSELDAAYRWSVYQRGNEILFVNWHENWAKLDDQGAFARLIGAGDGAELMQEGFAEFGELWVTASSTMARPVPEWSYMPADGVQPGEHAGIVVFETRIRPGSREAYGENTEAVVKMLAEIGYPYPVFGNRTVMGDESLTTFVVLHDGLSDFYGVNSVASLLEAAGIGEAWGSLFEARSELIMGGGDNWNAGYRPDLSYQPDDG